MMGSQDIWAVLGTERTNDVLIIRRAYARKLKITNPEDDAEAFERLRAAYDQAMALAGRMMFVQRQPAPDIQPAPEVRPTPEVRPAPGALPAHEAQPASRTQLPPLHATPLQQLQLDFQALDAAIIDPTDRDEARLCALFAKCLASPALENVQVLLQFERSVATWLLMRRPASEILFADAIARFEWQRRERSVGLPPDIASVLRHLRDLQFWAVEQESKGPRRRARQALLRKPNPTWLRLQMVLFNLDRHVKVLLGEIYAAHDGLVSRLNADAVAWWREYFSKPRLVLRWLSLLILFVPAGGVIGTEIGLAGGAAVRDGVAGAILPVALIAGILLFRLYVIDWPKRWYLQKSKAGVSAWMRLGWFAASSGTLALSAVLRNSSWGVAAAVLLGGFCVTWVSVVTPDALRGTKNPRHVVGYWLLLNFPLLFAWSIVAADSPEGPAVPTWLALFALLVAERIGRGALFDEYKFGLSLPARKTLPYAIAAAACAALALSMILPAKTPWVWIDMSILSIIVLIARTPGLVLTGVQSKIRYYALWLPAFVILETGTKGQLLASNVAAHMVQVIAVWLMAGVLLGMAMVGYNQAKSRAVVR
jgi:hypothetical protein